MSGKLSFAIPSKGRLKDAAAELFARGGMALRKTGHDRGYRAFYVRLGLRPCARIQ